jgi:hypothetical protein
MKPSHLVFPNKPNFCATRMHTLLYISETFVQQMYMYRQLAYNFHAAGIYVTKTVEKMSVNIIADLLRLWNDWKTSQFVQENVWQIFAILQTFVWQEIKLFFYKFSSILQVKLYWENCFASA